MKYFFKNIDRPTVNIYPLSDWHVGAKQCDLDFIKRIVKRIKDDPDALWISIGDLGECVTRTSKGNVFEQLYSPGDQLRICTELLAPIADKGLFGIRGNHGNRIDKETGVGWDELLCARVGVPYAGVAGFAGIQLNHGTKRASFSVYAHHGSGGPNTPSGKIRAAQKPNSFVVADIILTGHTHCAGECFPPRVYAYLDNVHRRIRWNVSRCYACGSAYDGRSGYVEEKLWQPNVPEHLCLHVRTVRKRRNSKECFGVDVQCEIIRDHPDDTSNKHELAKWLGQDEPLLLED